MLTFAALLMMQTGWTYITTGATGTRLLYDPTTIRAVGNYRQAWFQWDFSADKTETARSAKELIRVDCANESTATVSAIYYAANGRVLRSSTFNEFQISLEPAAPGTVAARMVKVICDANYFDRFDKG